MFNTEKVLYDSKVKEKVEYYDIYVNEEKEKIYFVSLNNNTIGLYELPTTKISKAVPELVKSLNYHDKVDKAVLTKSKIYLITGNKITSFDYTNEKTENKVIDKISYENLRDIRENGCIDHCNGQMKDNVDKLDKAINYIEDIYYDFYKTLDKETLKIDKTILNNDIYIYLWLCRRRLRYI